MTGAKSYSATCPKCKQVAPLRGKALTRALTCTSCSVYFCVDSNYQDQFLRPIKPVLKIGAQGRLNGVKYEIMGFTVKREKRYNYSWSEYLLFNPYHGIAFLSESNGHWNLLRPNPKHPWLANVKGDPETDQGTFQLYARFRAEVVYAQGEFFSDVIDSTESTQYFEYINPPYLLTYEQSGTVNASFLGAYIKRGEVARAFGLPDKSLPAKTRMGYTEPLLFSFNESTLVLTTLISVILAFFIQLMMNNGSLNQKIWQGRFDQANLGEQKVFVTPSFDLRGKKNLVVNMFAPVSNDWFFAEYSLINEATDEELVFTSEIEYYFGVEDGYSWREGSQEGEAFLSSIPEGRYHINIYPEFSAFNHEITISIQRDVPFYSNLTVMVLLLLAFPIGFYIYKYMRNVKRWEDSDYSPFH